MMQRNCRIRTNPGIIIPSIIIIGFVLLAILAPVITPYDYDAIDLPNRLCGINAAHIFGTDEMGRDLLTRVLYGGRISLTIGIVVPLISTSVGTLIGMLAGYSGKVCENVLMRIVDALMAFPETILILLMVFVMGGSVGSVVFAIAFINFPWAARIAYSETMKVRGTGYVEAAVVVGVKKSTIILRHILPNIRKTMLVVCMTTIPTAIISESTVSFLGLGIPPQMASWGTMINTGKQFLFSNPELCLIPCAAIAILALAFNVLAREIDKLYV